MYSALESDGLPQHQKCKVWQAPDRCPTRKWLFKSIALGTGKIVCNQLYARILLFCDDLNSLRLIAVMIAFIVAHQYLIGSHACHNLYRDDWSPL